MTSNPYMQSADNAMSAGVAADATAAATLALAYEQRTANLIAFLVLDGTKGVITPYDLPDEIRNRLGLGEQS